MKKLRLLQLSHVQLNGSFEEFPKGLRWLYWFEFPLDSVPIEFPMENLVVLEMQYSKLRQLWKGKKYLPSLKIIDISHSHDLIETGDFSSVPNLERLIFKDCASLLGVDESIGNLGKLIYLDMEDCKVIRKLPNNIALLKSLETLLISGCSNLNELRVEIISRMESLKVFRANEIPINRWVTTTQEVKSWATTSLGNSWAFFSPTLVELSLRNCNLSDDIFPREFGNLFSLKKLDLMGNPICSLPNCVRGLRRLQLLDFSDCTSLKSLVGLPRASQLYMNFCTSLEKVAFQSISCLPDRLGLFLGTKTFDKDVPSNLIEFEYWFKLEPIRKVNAEVINLWSLSDLESLTPIRMRTISGTISGTLDSIQGLSEYGIFGTFFVGNENKVPRQFRHRSKASLPLCFTVPLLPNSIIRGLNIFSVYALTTSASRPEGCIPADAPVLTVIKNKSKGLMWIYIPSCWGIPCKGEDVIWLSHWNFGNQLEAGDQVSISVHACHHDIQVREWGFHVVQEPVEKMFSQHNTDLNVIGGNMLELYLLIPGTYLLFGGPIELGRLSKRLFLQSIFNFSNLIADLNAEAEVDWQRVLFGEVLEAVGWQAMFGEALDAGAEVERQRLFWETLGSYWQMLLEADADWQKLFGEAFFKNFSGLIANSNIEAKAGNEDRQQSEETLAVAPIGESEALRSMVIDIIDKIIPGVLEEFIW
ncbi:hypothetical protein M0R45_034844 [Rubus argutus]|uniref:Uncharacterized protein n=1 Tax=Rubus argutus TaxID=59490 RepID=A0AAW1VT16_RUBAR